ncbi:hypothetical protein MHU86_9785 [Fragilaria crotonensis]|nr:hypothetical protein MHU86_9785 [Fragilaria crotonensis]
MGKKRQREDPVQDIYRDVISIAPRPDTGNPGTPHSFFASSYDVCVLSSKLVVHTHANGLCVVTWKQDLSQRVVSIDYLIQPAPDKSAAERRKRQAALLKRGLLPSTLPGVVLPTTVMANLTLEDGTVLPVYAGVWGTVVEINDNMCPELLQRDPLLDGYFAIIQPVTGGFPPRTLDRTCDETEAKVSKKICAQSYNHDETINST